MDVVPLTPTVVDCVTFDRAPLGRRGYNEDQVDDFLDRVQATLAGNDNLTAQAVRDVVFDPAAFIKRGYHEDQVDEFLDLVVEELSRREGGLPTPRQAPPAPTANTQQTVRTPVGLQPPRGPVPRYSTQLSVPTQPWQAPPPTAAEQTAPMLFSQPPSMPAPGTQPLKREKAASGPPNSSLPASTDKTAVQKPADPSESPIGTESPANGKPALEAGERPAAVEVEPPAAEGTTDSPTAVTAVIEPAITKPPVTELPETTAIQPPVDAPAGSAIAAPAAEPSTAPQPQVAAEPGTTPQPPTTSGTPGIPPAPDAASQPQPAPGLPDTPDATQQAQATTETSTAPQPQTTPGAPDTPPAPSAIQQQQAIAEAPATPEVQVEATPSTSAQPATESQPATSLLAAPLLPIPIVAPAAETHVTQSPAAPPAGTGQAPAPEAWRDSEHLALPLPPAPPGERGYRPGDVERLMQLLTAVLDSPEAPDPTELADLKLSRTFFVGQGYHAGAVDALRQAWLDELTRRAL